MIRTNDEIIDLIEKLSDSLRGRTFTTDQAKKLRHVVEYLNASAIELTAHSMEPQS